MKKISRDVFFIKKILPFIWLIIPVVMIASDLHRDGNENYIFLAWPILLGASGYFSIKKSFGNLVDGAYDCETYLLVKNRNQEERIEFYDVMNVNVDTHINPPRISLRLRTPGKFGSEVSFSPVSEGFTFNLFAKNKTAEDLIARVDRANSRNSI